MSQMPESPATARIPVQLSEPEFIAFIFPHLSMPRRGPKCKLGYHRVFNLILWVLYTGMQWKCLPVPEASDGTAVIHYTTVYKVFAKWSDDGSLDQAFIASVRHLAEQNHLDLSVLHGDGSNTVAKKNDLILAHSMPRGPSTPTTVVSPGAISTKYSQKLPSQYPSRSSEFSRQIFATPKRRNPVKPKFRDIPRFLW